MAVRVSLPPAVGLDRGPDRLAVLEKGRKAMVPCASFLLLFAAPVDSILGPGSEIAYDAGYTMRTNAAGKITEQWISIPTTVVVVGIDNRGVTKPCYSCVRKGTEREPDEYFLLPVHHLKPSAVLKRMPGALPEMTGGIPLRYEPPTKERK